MPIGAFYSYKGGVGRSIGLANVAICLCQKGYEVGIMDIDVDSAGQHHIFNVKPQRNDRELLSILINEDTTLIEPSVITIYSKGGLNKNSGALFLLPTVSDDKKLEKIPWDDPTNDFLNLIFTEFIKMFSLDFLLLDSRTGLSAPAHSTLKYSDFSVIFFKLDRQNLFGMELIKNILETSGKKHFFVASMIPKSELVKKYIKRFKDKGINIYTTIPYEMRLAFEEILVTKLSPRTKIAGNFRAIADACEKIMKEG